jgi:hypothetical protein
MAGTLALLVPVMCSEMGSGIAEDVLSVALHGRIGEGWMAAKLDGGIDKGMVTTSSIDREWVTSELGGIAEWAREAGGEDKYGGNEADDIEAGIFD